MSCRMPECHRVRPNGSVVKLDHDKDTSPGATFYYCSIHHVYHCVAVRAHRRLPQPLCGECAWLFFKFPKEAAKHPESDITATAGPGDERVRQAPDVADSSPKALSRIKQCSGPDDYGTYMIDADGDIIMRDVILSSEQRNDLPTIPASRIVHLPIQRSRDGNRDDFLQFIPYDNPAVFDVRPAQWHRIRRGVFLFRYTDYRGWPAVQPVADERRIRAYFKPLDVIEGDGFCDRALIEAR
ncbi:hypothetical protein F4774DRAFT_409613 [Daldinia eschscholtzii]|nr:hypothetical protein F4774DRAFT_409613 [Daldinia eschscholtzii]